MVGPAEFRGNRDLSGHEKEVVEPQHPIAGNPPTHRGILQWPPVLGVRSEASGTSSRNHEVSPERPSEADFGARHPKFCKPSGRFNDACLHTFLAGSLPASLIAIAVDA